MEFIDFLNEHKVLFFTTVIALSIALWAALVGPYLCNNALQSKQIEQLDQVEHYYLDGREVDPDTIDPRLYEFTIDGDTCYLTK